MKKIRIDDIECRQTIYKPKEYEIVKWYENERYGKEQQLVEEGYVKEVYKDGSWGLKKDNHTINESCFKHPESCYVIAWLKPNYGEPDVDMETVGSRVLDLEADELDLFMQVYRLANSMILGQMKEEESTQ